MSKTPPKREDKKPESKKSTSATAGSTKELKASTSEPKTKMVKAKKAAASGAAGAQPPTKVCKIKDCKRDYKSKGYCKTHYKKWRQGAYGMARYTTCHDNDCRKPMALNRFGFCEDHYQNYYVKGIKAAKVEAPAKPAAAPKAEEKAAG